MSLLPVSATSVCSMDCTTSATTLLTRCGATFCSGLAWLGLLLSRGLARVPDPPPPPPPLGSVLPRPVACCLQHNSHVLMFYFL